jgi:hypothetical protein
MKNPKERPTAKKVMDHQWFSSVSQIIQDGRDAERA